VPSEFAKGAIKYFKDEAVLKQTVYKNKIQIRQNPTKVNKLKIKKFYATKKS